MCPECVTCDMAMQTSNSKHNTKPGKNADDTFSFTSCSLKKLLASESPKLMMALIIIVGTLTLILVLKCICCPAIISDLTETREKRNDAVNEIVRKPWEASKSKLMSEFSELIGKDNRDSNLHSGGDYPEYLSPDLSSILDPIKVNEGYSSNNLRDFYRKLLKTDIQIKNLKKGFANTNKRVNLEVPDPNARLKRSLRIFGAPRRHETNKGNFNNRQTDGMKIARDAGKNKEAAVRSNDLEKGKEGKLQHQRDAKDKKDDNELDKKDDNEFKSFQTEDEKAKDNMKPFNKYTQWEDVFGRESSATQHRRLLQNDDDDDEDGATEDYEEQTKEPWERDKRTAGHIKLEINVQTEGNVHPKVKQQKPKTSQKIDFGPTTPFYNVNEEINFLIDAAMKMKSDESHGHRIRLKSNGASKPNNTSSKNYILNIFSKKFWSEMKNVKVETTKTSNVLEKNSTMTIVTTTFKPTMKTTQKHKERNIMFSGHRRSLKSVKIDELNDGFASTTNDIESRVINNDHLEDNKENNQNSLRFYGLVTRPLSQRNNTVPEKGINNTQPMEPSIDKEIMENIGHKSRVLFSFEEPAENVTSTASEQVNESYVVTNKQANMTSETKLANISEIETKNKESNRTVVKRSADGDSIFWNDMYDDEYGIKDPMEDDMKDKSSVKFNDLMGKDNWIGTKFKMLAKSFKDRRNRKMGRKKDVKFKNARNRTSTHNKRSVSVSNDSGKRVFEDLTANMKKVCQEAAQAIHETTNREVRADGDQATSLMQQVVGLMSELVDLQVKQKTCMQLPDDLRSFLAWLMSPNTEERNDGFSVDTFDSGPMSAMHNLDDLLSPDARSECLGTIHDVEDLIMQYDEMSEEDKSKMSGVREYLEHQLHYLHQQLSNYNEYGSSVVYQEQVRKRRQPKLHNKRKRKSYKFLNYYGKKHTKRTSIDDITEDYKNIKEKEMRKENDDIKDRKHEGNRFFENNEIGEGNLNNRDVARNVEDEMKNLDDLLSALVKENDSFVKYNKI
ncbi:uncharacterized protein LOC125238970 [Leguminivora glycinivorella]|uniref:uncharacterized protein LOC125238970 n=1 Tax=Leguminivora glycinivorella TaxID=1035111 RepID=UPI00200C7E33|nr:uncharacterized protein LOC125238970 [Leguminivora glycinivorella]